MSAPKKKITFTIDPKGNVKVENLCGFGKDCEQATQDMEKLLGAAQENSRARTEQYDELPEAPLDIDIDQGPQ